MWQCANKSIIIDSEKCLAHYYKLAPMKSLKVILWLLIDELQKNIRDNRDVCNWPIVYH